ncbi:putative quinol monooxygenase [Burkholderia ubonensis]|uniref:Antibiotic biosynthesis monooxygenase n=1 Tax=Burkholderia ubonensis subsp. mesacidophila TaxID=265293 RepID=A0A2A4FGV5_9BURK|nr:putative quinol monooxygenase [Burkholderia ubonensis]PCE32355.1 antibiotic biosynthesis monooxygenase [Burkholderia ubonensis subsp. mesacidophila]
MKDLHIVAVLYAKPGQEAQLRKDLTALAAPSQNEEGNLRYEVHVDNQDPRRFVFVEHWADAALRAKHHTQGEHILRFHAGGAQNIERAEVFELSRIA